MSSIWHRSRGYVIRNSARFVFKRAQRIRLDSPVISFTFDDFPRSALFTAGDILGRYGLAGTYYTALGIMGQESPSGALFTADDLNILLNRGHELGCHTYTHCHSWETPSSVFEESVIRNSAQLNALVPGARFHSFSYPISEPKPLNKRCAGRHFACCRAGGQTHNSGIADLNQLSSFFLERSRENFQAVADLIDANRKACGWLIFSTHDVRDEPGPYGCTPEFFERVVRCAIATGSRVLPVAAALQIIRGKTPTSMRLNQARPSLDEDLHSEMPQSDRGPSAVETPNR